MPYRQTDNEVAMHGWVWRAGSAAIALSLFTLPAGAADTSRMLAQNVSDAKATEPSQPPVANASAALPVNTPEQIRKAQTELVRLDCLRGRIDGKLGGQTRQAVKKFWTSARQPAVEVIITDELISDLADRGAGFCRPARRFFAVGSPMRPGGAPPFMRGARSPVAPAAVAPR